MEVMHRGRVEPIQDASTSSALSRLYFVSLLGQSSIGLDNLDHLNPRCKQRPVLTLKLRLEEISCGTSLEDIRSSLKPETDFYYILAELSELWVWRGPHRQLGP